ncbi:hypothetical protein [Nostoc sp. UHCC 0251]|nr:hypothetical protein [Nostoc sp. UHCC 0251]MEA5624548.1 hypothetical protein [Nostoc sp. UHCC 0251]
MVELTKHEAIARSFNIKATGDRTIHTLIQQRLYAAMSTLF